MAAGLAVNLLLLFVDSDYLVVILTALYGVGMIQLLVDNAGSFADAYQGIVMFGDPTQVGHGADHRRSGSRGRACRDRRRLHEPTQSGLDLRGRARPAALPSWPPQARRRRAAGAAARPPLTRSHRAGAAFCAPPGALPPHGT